MSLSDGGVQATMPVAPTGMMNSGFGGFGGDGAWWIIILFLFVFCGWGERVRINVMKSLLNDIEGIIKSMD